MIQSSIALTSPNTRAKSAQYGNRKIGPTVRQKKPTPFYGIQASRKHKTILDTSSSSNATVSTHSVKWPMNTRMTVAFPTLLGNGLEEAIATTL